MLGMLLTNFVDLFVPLFSVLIIVRVVMSYFVGRENRLFDWLMGVTEPVLGPIRKVLPPMAGLDLSPLAALFLLEGLRYLVYSLVG